MMQRNWANQLRAQATGCSQFFSCCGNTDKNTENSVQVPDFSPCNCLVRNCEKTNTLYFLNKLLNLSIFIQGKYFKVLPFIRQITIQSLWKMNEETYMVTSLSLICYMNMNNVEKSHVICPTNSLGLKLRISKYFNESPIKG